MFQYDFSLMISMEQTVCDVFESISHFYMIGIYHRVCITPITIEQHPCAVRVDIDSHICRIFITTMGLCKTFYALRTVKFKSEYLSHTFTVSLIARIEITPPRSFKVSARYISAAVIVRQKTQSRCCTVKPIKPDSTIVLSFDGTEPELYVNFFAVGIHSEIADIAMFRKPSNMIEAFIV